MKTLKNFVTSILFFSLCGCPFSSDKFVKKDYFPEAKYQTNSVGGYLNPIFKQMTRQCDIVPSEVKDPDFSADYIAREIRETLTITKNANTAAMAISAVYTDWHPAMLFLYPFSATERQAFTEAIQDPSKKFPVLSETFITENPTVKPAASNLRKDSLPQNMEGIPAMLYRQSCGSYASGAANASVSFPIASLKSALEKEYKNDTVISFVTGYYESPLYKLVSENSPAGLYARIVLLETYKRIQDITAKDSDGVRKPIENLYQLMGFRGGFYKLGTVSNRKTKVDLSGSAGGTYGIASGQVSSEASFDSDATYNEDTHGLLIWQANSNNFAPLPTTETLLQEITQFGKLASFVGEHQTFMENHDHIHKMSIMGLPENVCKGSWTVEDLTANIYSTGPSISTSFNATNTIPECIFEITGKADRNITKNNRSVKMAYTLKSGLDIVGTAGIANVKFKIDNSEVFKFPTTDLPKLTVEKTDRQKIISENKKVSYEWNALISSQDLAADPVNYDEEQAVSISSINCPSVGIITAISDFSGDAKIKRLNLKLKTSDDFGDREGWEEEICKVQGTAHLALASGVKIDRPIDLNVKIPTKAPTSAITLTSRFFIKDSKSVAAVSERENIFKLMQLH